MSLRLIIEDFEGDRMVVPLPEDEGPVTLGRAPDNHVRLPERNVSRRHAELHPREGSWVLVDADSYNGITVNGEAVDGDCRLEVGDFIILADYQLLLGSQANALEEDVAALTAATQRRRQSLLDSQDSGPMAEILPSTFPSAEDGLGAAMARTPIENFEDDGESTGSKGRPGLWFLGAVAAMSVAGVLAWKYGQSAAGPLMERGKQALAAAGVRSPVSPPPQVEKVAPQPPSESPAKPAADQSAKTQEGGSTAVAKTPLQASDAPSSLPDAAVKPAEPESAQPTPGTSAPTKPIPNTSAPGRRFSRAREREVARAKEQQAKALIKRARKAAMGGKHQEAMSLARRSFRASPNQDALQVLGLSACKAPNRGLAEFAYNRLRRAESRRILVKLCGDAGINLD